MIGKFSPYVTTSPSGKMRLCCRYEDELTGKIKTATVALDKDTKKARNKAEVALQIKIEGKKKESAQERKKLRLSDLVTAYVADLEANPDATPSTKKRNRIAVQSVSKIIGEDVLLDKLPEVDILGRLTATGETSSRKNERLKRFGSLVRWGFSHNYIADIQFLEKLKRFKDVPHKEKIKDKFMEGHEYRKVRDAMKLDKYRLFFEFQCMTGMRTGETIALTKNDVDLVGRTITIDKSFDSNAKVLTHAKTESSMRKIHIQPELLELLYRIDKYYKRQDLRTGKRSDLLFHSETGEPFSYYSFKKYLHRITELVLGRSLTPHATRHTHASLLFEQEYSIEEVQERLGHSDSKITKAIYIHVTNKLKEKRNQRLDAFRIG